jgi:hypothetical protein
MDKFIANLKSAAEESPLIAVGVAVAGVSALTKLLNANTERKNSKAWAKEVDRRVRKSK